jgi:hypothetical protein
MRLLGVHDRWLVTPSRSDPDVVIGRFGRPLVHGHLRPRHATLADQRMCLVDLSGYACRGLARSGGQTNQVTA